MSITNPPPTDKGPLRLRGGCGDTINCCGDNWIDTGQSDRFLALYYPDNILGAHQVPANAAAPAVPDDEVTKLIPLFDD